MKTVSIKVARITVLFLVGLGVPFAAYAQHVALSVVVPGPAYVPPPVVVARPPVYVAPRPVYVPPPVVVARPPVYVAPRPVYVRPPPVVYVAPAPALVIGWHNNQYWDGHRYWHRDEYLQFHHGDFHGYGHHPY